MKTVHYTYPIQLTQDQQIFLRGVLRTRNVSAHHARVARVLLQCDLKQERAKPTDAQIAEGVGISRRNLIRIKKQFVQEGLQITLAGHYPTERPEQRCLDGEREAKLMTLACSKAPDGHQRWSIRLLADQMVQLQIVDHISPETVRQALKKK